MSRLQNAITLARSQGLVNLSKYTAERFVEEYYERKLGINTGAEIYLDTLGITDADAVRHAPTSYLAFWRAMRAVKVDYATSSFVDYGSGLGRILVCAGTYPFKEVVGVEFAPELQRGSLENISNARGLRAKSISAETMNAMDFRLHAGHNVFHLFNPFLGETLRTVVGNIAQSLRDHPREAWIIFGSPWQMSRIMAEGKIIPAGWVKSTEDFLFPFNRDRATGDKNGYLNRVYRLDSRPAPLDP